MPVLVKRGAVIFKTEPVQYIDKKCDGWSKITLEIFPDNSGSKTLWQNPHESHEIIYSVKNEKISVKSDIEADIIILGDKKYNDIIER